MMRTKWMRLLVRDLGDVIRWTGAQQARSIGEFRYRAINGREVVSFRLVPRYPIEIGARDIIVVAHVRARGWPARARELLGLVGAVGRDRWWRLRAEAELPSAAPEPAGQIAELRSVITVRRPVLLQN